MEKTQCRLCNKIVGKRDFLRHVKLCHEFYVPFTQNLLAQTGITPFQNDKIKVGEINRIMGLTLNSNLILQVSNDS